MNTSRSENQHLFETVKQIHDMVLEAHKLKMCEIVETICTSHGSVVSFWKDHLGMRKLCARWVPCLLTIDPNRSLARTSKECSALFHRNEDKFLHLFITVDGK